MEWTLYNQHKGVFIHKNRTNKPKDQKSVKGSLKALQIEVVYEQRNDFSVKALLQLEEKSLVARYYYRVKTFSIPDRYIELKDVIQAINEEHESVMVLERISGICIISAELIDISSVNVN